MAKYFNILNWCLLAAVLAIHFGTTPLTHSWAQTVGAVLGAMFTGGLTSWQYHKDSDPEKNRKWCKRYFNKDYRMEAIVQLFIALLFSALGLWLSTKLLAVSGFSLLMLTNYLVEWAFSRRMRRSV